MAFLYYMALVLLIIFAIIGVMPFILFIIILLKLGINIKLSNGRTNNSRPSK